MLVEQLDQLGKVCQRSGQAIDLVNYDHVNVAGPHFAKEMLQGRTIMASVG